MANPKALGSDINTARKLFFEQGENPHGRVPEIIARSWQRCVQRLDNRHTKPPLRVDSNQLSEQREKMNRLRAVAQPEMDALAELVSDSDSLVLLANEQGLILDAAGSLEFLHKAQQVYLQPGIAWRETDRGTNAIGTALIEKRPVLVQGAEHFLDANEILSCAAAPILSPQGVLLGILDVSGDSVHMHRQALGMVRLAIQMIEHRLASRDAAPSSLLRFHQREDLLGTHREGILLLDDSKVIGANRIALQLLNSDWQKIVGSDAEQWLQLPGISQSSSAQQIKSSNGVNFHARINHKQSLQIPCHTSITQPKKNYYFDQTTNDLLSKAKRIVDADIPVLIQGETGVGKEIFARHLHSLSQRRSGPFVAINCAALPESLVESELFGYASGAFTGAQRQGMPGRIREADGGILFLDEIGDMPLSLQARLLRVLQDQQVTPLGGGQTVKVDFTLLCATNQNLQQLVNSGAFRADLLYRIQGFSLSLQPLRDRKERQQLILEIFKRLSETEPTIRLSQTAISALVQYEWPGNFRQLVSTIRTLLVLTDADAVIELQQLPAAIQACLTNTKQTQSNLKSLTRTVIESALKENNNNISATARQLGIHRSTLYRHLATDSGQ
ncbi:MAG: sigma-54-dependent Fis family transcriptional regulator [Candidatus Thiodiazotropha sp.]